MKLFKFITALFVLVGVNATALAAGELITKVQGMEEVGSVSLNAQNLKTWKRSSFNNNNLQVKDGNIIINSVKVGPLIQHDIILAKQLVEVNFTIKALEPDTDKAVIQNLIVVNSKDETKSNLYGYRVGKDFIRFADDKPVAVTPDENGNINVKVLVDIVSGKSEAYVNGGTEPVITHGPIVIKKGQEKVVFGDGSSAVEGSCAIISAEVKEY